MSDIINKSLVTTLRNFEVDVNAGDINDANLPLLSPYVSNIRQQSTLKLFQEPRVRKAYKDSGFLGFFRLFIIRSWFEAMRTWLNSKRKKNGMIKVNEFFFNAY